jgi:hypothetical protein
VGSTPTTRFLSPIVMLWNDCSNEPFYCVLWAFGPVSIITDSSKVDYFDLVNAIPGQWGNGGSSPSRSAFTLRSSNGLGHLFFKQDNVGSNPIRSI